MAWPIPETVESPIEAATAYLSMRPVAAPVPVPELEPTAALMDTPAAVTVDVPTLEPAPSVSAAWIVRVGIWL
jgi:hypothetical protein